jgi:hypothetical protein
VEYGNLLTLPLDNGILYVEPAYIRATSNNSYPFMKKVLLSYGDYVAFADTVQAGITDLLTQAKNGVPSTPPVTPPANPPPSSSPSAPPSTTAPPGNSAALTAAINNINKALTDLSNAQKRGDFAAYGQALQELNDAIAAYSKALNSASASPTAPPTPTPSK